MQKVSRGAEKRRTTAGSAENLKRRAFFLSRRVVVRLCSDFPLAEPFSNFRAAEFRIQIVSGSDSETLCSRGRELLVLLRLRVSAVKPAQSLRKTKLWPSQCPRRRGGRNFASVERKGSNLGNLPTGTAGSIRTLARANIFFMPNFHARFGWIFSSR